MFSACGPGGLPSCSRASSRCDQFDVQVEEVERLELVAPGLLEQPVKRLAGDRPSAETGDHGAATRVAAHHRLVDVGGDDPAPAGGQGLLENHHAAGPRQSVADLLEGERPEGLDAERAHPDADVAHLVDDLLDRPQHRAERHDDRLRALGSVAAHQAAGGSAEVDREPLGDLGDHVEGLHLLVVGEVLDLEEGLGTDHRPDRHGVRGVEQLPGLEGGHERVDLLLVGDVDLVVGVGEDEAVHADHHRQRDLLGDPEGLDVQVERLLVRLGVELDPAGVAHRHGVGVVVPDVDRGSDRPVGDRHHDRQPQARRVVERLGHEEDALGGRRRIGARAGGGCADRRGERAELGLDHQVLAGGEVPGPDQVGEVLDDVGLGRDRVGADHLGAAERHRLGDGAGSLLLPKHGSAPGSRAGRTRTRRRRRACCGRRSRRRTSGRSPGRPPAA